MSSSTALVDDETYTITELAKEFDITTRTIRFYEDQGLITPRREGRKRVYSKRDRTRLKLTLRGKRLGFSLGETRSLIELFDTPKGEEKQLRQFLSDLNERRALLEQQQRDIEAVMEEIDAAYTVCSQRLNRLRQPDDNPSRAAPAQTEDFHFPHKSSAA